jgi:hypothetical protein
MSCTLGANRQKALASTKLAWSWFFSTSYILHHFSEIRWLQFRNSNVDVFDQTSLHALGIFHLSTWYCGSLVLPVSAAYHAKHSTLSPSDVFEQKQEEKRRFIWLRMRSVESDSCQGKSVGRNIGNSSESLAPVVRHAIQISAQPWASLSFA